MKKGRLNFVSFLLVLILSVATACTVTKPSSESESGNESEVLSETLGGEESLEESVEESLEESVEESLEESVEESLEESVEESESESVYVVEGETQHVYKVFTETVTWYEAEAYCKKYGGHLATITTEEEQKAIESIILATGSYYWIGGSDFFEEGKWEWVTGEEWAYENWVENAPDGATDQNHLRLGSDKDEYKWRDGTHSEKNGYICEWEEELIVVAEDEIVYNDHRYKIIGSPTSWEEAKEYCEKRSGHLVTVTDAKEQAIVEKLASGRQVWLGASDEEEEGVWKWVTGEEWTYDNWLSGEPNNTKGEENWLHLFNNPGKWNDTTIRGNDYFICEWEPEFLEYSGSVSGIYIEGTTQQFIKCLTICL